jgi:plastocyanin
MKRLSLTFGLVVLAVLAAACSTGAAPSVSSGPVDPNTPVVVAQGSKFAPSTVTVTAGKVFTLRFDNKDGVPHNLAVYKDSSASTKVSIGQIVTSSTADQQVPALERGEYFFRCDVHHEMTGTIVVQ